MVNDRIKSSGVESFLDTICPYSWLISAGFGIAALFALINLFSVVYLPPTADTYPVAVMALALNGVLLAMLGPLLYLCRRHNYG